MLFSDNDRLIYTSPDQRRFDPLAVYHNLLVASRNGINPLLADWESSDPVTSAAAAVELAALARTVFGYPAFDAEAGATDATVLKTLRDYLEWTEKNG